MDDNKQLKILILPSFYPTPEQPVSGMFFKDQVLALRRFGIDAGVAYPEKKGIQSYTLRTGFSRRFQGVSSLEDGIPTTRILGWGFAGRFTVVGLFYGYMYLRSVEAYMKQYGKPDLIHVHQARWAGYGGMLAAKKYGIPYLITEHESYFAEGKIPSSAMPYLRYIYAGAKKVMAVSRAMATAMHEVFDPDQITIVPNMVDTDHFAPLKERAANPVFRFLSVARLAGIKRFDILIKSFAKAFAGNPTVELEIAGDGPERDTLALMINELNLGRQVHLTGAVKHENVRQLMWNADAFVLASDVETFGVVLIEALASGLPLISTKCGGPEDVVTPDVGILVDCGDVDGLAKAMKQLRAESEKYNKTALIQSANNRFGEQAICSRLQDIYAEALA